MGNKKKDWRLETSKFKKFWYYVWYDDSLLAHMLYFGLAFIFIKFMLFPTLGLFLNNDYPIVAIVSGSMQHKIVDGQVCGNLVSEENGGLSYDSWWSICGSYYEDNFGITKEEFSDFEYSNGLNIGDVMVLYGRDVKDIEVGETLIFYPNMSCIGAPPGPVIHRLIEINEIGDSRIFLAKGGLNRQL